MKTGGYPCEHGYYGICAQCVREERDEIRARVAELEARIAELQPMAQCAAIMAVCGYFSRMRGPDAWLDHGGWDEYPELFACAGVDLRSFQHGTRFYAGSAPVPAAKVEAKVADGVVLPDHEPTIAIGEILDGYDDEDRDDVWDSIKAYADVHARAALEAASIPILSEAPCLWVAFSDNGSHIRMWSAEGPEKIEDSGLTPIQFMLAAKAKGGS